MSLTKPELQKIMRKFRLNVDGKRLDLIARLKDHLSTIEEDEAEDDPDTDRLRDLVEKFNEMRHQQERQTRILEEIRNKVSADSPPPTDDEVSVNNNNAPPPMTPEETAVMMRMQRKKAMSKMSALPPERGLTETESEAEGGNLISFT